MNVIINPIFPIWITLTIAGILSVFFVYKEIQRTRQFVSLRVSLQLIVMLSLVGLILRPSYRGKGDSESILVLTKGYDSKKADSLSRKHSLKVFQTKDAARFPNAEMIESWHHFADKAQSIQYVMGEGIPTYALDEFDRIQFKFISGNEPIGIVRLELKPLKVNVPTILNGQSRAIGNDVTLQLLGPGGVEDSTTVNGNGVIPFSLTAKPKQSGKFIYQLVTKENGKIVQTENLPVEIESDKQLNILFLQSYPTFETRYLKNYLSEKGHSVLVRYQVSKNTFRYEFANRESESIPVINASALNSYDLVITSSEVFQSLSSSEQQALEASLKNGLGVLLMFNQTPGKKFKELFSIETVAVKSDTSTFMFPNGKEKYTLPAIPIRVGHLPEVERVITDSKQQTLAGYFNVRYGKIGFQFLNETYRLALEGKANEYARLWSPLIDGVARAKQEAFKIFIKSSFPFYQNQPVKVNVVSSSEKTPELFLDSIRVPLKEDVTINNYWHGEVWPTPAGWQAFTLQDSTQLNFYVSDNKEWNALKINNQILKNLNFEMADRSTRPPVLSYHLVSPLIFFLLFLLGSGLLWLLAKL
jgi:hypothetical protein